MKMNKWTVGLAAAGVVSLSSVAQAQEAAANAVQTKLATTSLSGYVSTSFNWVAGDDTGAQTGYRLGDAENDQFSLDVISLSLGSPAGSGEWATGYNVQLWLGPDSDNLGVGGGGGAAVKNAYIELRVPVGSGLDLQVGRFDTIIGYEGIDYNNNPFFSHSWGYAIQPTLHTGVKATYQVAEEVSVSAIVANTHEANDNEGADNDSRKTYGFAATIGAPDSMGFLSDAELTVGYISGRETTGADDIQNLYIGASLPTPITDLSAGITYDVRDEGGVGGAASVLGIYLAYKVNDQMTVNARFEKVEEGGTPSGAAELINTSNADAIDLTLGVDYAIWDGVKTRAEWRQTHVDDQSTATDAVTNALLFNIIYEF